MAVSPLRQRPAAKRRRVSRELLDNPRYEVLPVSRAFDHARVLPRGSTVTVTSSPRHELDATLRLTEALSARGFHAVPHLAARLVPDVTALRGIIDRLDRAAVSDVFVVGGDSPTPTGEFDSGLQLLDAMNDLGHPFTQIGVPAYPEGHAVIGTDALWEALTAKQRYATYAVTQLCFDTSAISQFGSDARSRGIALRLYAGVPGVVDVRRLLRISLNVGVGESLRFARSHASIVSRLVRPGGYRPDLLVADLSEAPVAGQLAGLHLYTFNQVEPTFRWVRHATRRVARVR